jgi:Ca2+-binding RTX toxin-like protein
VRRTRDDVLDGGANLSHESGGDRYYFNGGWGKDTITDTEYAEYVSFSGCRRDAVPITGVVQTDLIIKLAPVRGPQVTDGTNTIEWGRLPIAWLKGRLGDDRITGDGRGNNLDGDLGQDIIRSGAGPDRIDAGHDRKQPDFVDCGDGNDTVIIDDSVDTVSANCEHVYP